MKHYHKTRDLTLEVFISTEVKPADFSLSVSTGALINIPE